MFVFSAFMTKCMLLLAAHFIGDFAFQNDWMAMNKGKDYEVLFYHVAVYAFTFVAFCIAPGMLMTVGAFVSIFASHFLIDTCKARWRWTDKIWVDQAAHITVIGGLLGLGWL